MPHLCESARVYLSSNVEKPGDAGLKNKINLLD